jgi:acyl-coenzyme A synthetase/AMP-(fatty) acid ligase
LDNVPLAWATHRLGGIQSPANAAYSASELEYQLKDSGAKCLFTCMPLLETAREAARKVGIPDDRIYLLELPKEASGSQTVQSEFKTVSDLIREGSREPQLEKLLWKKGEGGRRVAFLCYSSGTSGLPVGINSAYFKTYSRANPPQERSHDFAPKCDSQHHANQVL